MSILSLFAMIAFRLRELMWKEREMMLYESLARICQTKSLSLSYLGSVETTISALKDKPLSLSLLDAKEQVISKLEDEEVELSTLYAEERIVSRLGELTDWFGGDYNSYFIRYQMVSSLLSRVGRGYHLLRDRQTSSRETTISVLWDKPSIVPSLHSEERTISELKDKELPTLYAREHTISRLRDGSIIQISDGWGTGKV